MKCLAASVFLLSLLVLACQRYRQPECIPPDHGTLDNGQQTPLVYGFVTTEKNRPIIAKSIALIDSSGKKIEMSTDYDGYYRFDRLRVGDSYDLVMEIPGFLPFQKKVILSGTEETLCAMVVLVRENASSSIR